MHLAEKLHGTGHIEARDLTEYKVALIESNIARYGFTNVTARQQDATVQDAASVGTADVVIADLPCSGLGVLRKKTDIKYRMSAEQEKELVALQRQILGVVCDYVKAGGTLLYSTCTIHRAENEDNVAWFLEKHPEFELIQMRQIFPQRTIGDGFFLAKLRKRQ
jgi:16S rRNA (cytosine967-C5)-methyltransferase